MDAMRPRTVSEVLRAAITTAPVTRYRIAKDLGIGQSVLSRFLAGAQMDGNRIDRVAAYLGLRLVSDKGRKAKARKSKR